MEGPGEMRRVLVVRASLTRQWASGEQHGAVEAHAAVLARPHEASDYDSYHPYMPGDDEERKVRLEGFRAVAQTDGRQGEAYGFEWGYAAERGGLVTIRDVGRVRGHLAAVQRALDRIEAREGRAVGLGMEVMRLGRAIGASRVVAVAFDPSRSSFAGAAIEDSAAAADAPRVVSMACRLERRVQQACAAREGRAAA